MNRLVNGHLKKLEETFEETSSMIDRSSIQLESNYYIVNEHKNSCSIEENPHYIHKVNYLFPLNLCNGTIIIFNQVKC